MIEKRAKFVMVPILKKKGLTSGAKDISHSICSSHCLHKKVGFFVQSFRVSVFRGMELYFVECNLTYRTKIQNGNRI